MHMGPEMNTANLITACSINNKFPVTVAPRFRIWQGHKMVITKEGIEVHFLDEQGQEVRKLRCIDDFKINGFNAHTVLADKIVLSNFELTARITAEIFELLGEKAPELTLCFHHFFPAYRRVPNADSRRFGIVGIYNLDRDTVDWHEVLGLPFGLTAVPVIFNRLPAVICAIARVFGGVTVYAFFDDFICVDRADTPIKVQGVKGQQEQLWSSSAQWALDSIASMIGLDLEPSKHKPARPSNVLP